MLRLDSTSAGGGGADGIALNPNCTKRTLSTAPRECETPQPDESKLVRDTLRWVLQAHGAGVGRHFWRESPVLASHRGPVPMARDVPVVPGLSAPVGSSAAPACIATPHHIHLTPA